MTLKVCLNSIVKNESARILRMLESVRPYISTFALLDTGSTDDTVKVIEDWASEHGIKGTVGHATFVDFSQARNEALQLARDWWRADGSPPFTYLLLCDADMELKVDDPKVFDHLSEPSYRMVQKAGGVSYDNKRLMHVAPVEFKYVGVTHEYLACPDGGRLSGAYFVDHADGANRPDKISRDIRLLKADLATDPNNPRSWFYLANTYRDAGDYDDAIAAYRRRVELGDWDEEQWNAQVNIANCFKSKGDEGAFVEEALKAYNLRPSRAEPMHALAKFYREKDQSAVAAVFAEAAVQIPRPDDLLFVEDWVYEWGCKEEFAIAGYYNPRTRHHAFKTANELALSTSCPGYVRSNARRDMVFYLAPLSELCPSAKYYDLNFRGNAGFTTMNPCITSRPSGSLEVLLRTVNYRINETGHYMIGETGCWDAPIVTENWLVQLNDKFEVTGPATLINWDRPAAKFDKVIGLEDMRIWWNGGLHRHFSACVREQSEWGQCEQWSGTIRNGDVHDAVRVSDGTCTEKNWINWDDDRFVYRLDKLVDLSGDIEKIDRSVAVDNISGSSQWIGFARGRLSVVHESITHPRHGKRVYQHRFAWLSEDFKTLKLSVPFVFRAVQIEFCAGIARMPDGNIVLSYGVRDEKAELCTVKKDEIKCALGL